MYVVDECEKDPNSFGAILLCQKRDGKSLSISTLAPTPDGWKTMGDLKVGGYVFNPKGEPTKILKKSKRFTSRPCYKIHFSCGENVIADEEHLWEVNTSEKEELALMTSEIYDTFNDDDPYFIKEAIIPSGYDKPSHKGDHYIIKIEKTDPVPVQCITVDCPSHLFLCGNNFIPTHNSGKSTTTVTFLVHCLLFEEHTSIAILANKASTAKDILGRLQTAYENLPRWMQQGVKSWNKTSMELENGSKVVAASTSASSVRGGTYSILMLDEYAFVPEHVAETFMKSVYPTITSGKNTKVIVVSCVTKDTYLLTPNGYRKIDKIIDTDKSGAYIVPEYQVMGKEKFYSSNIVVNQGKVPTNIIKTRYEEIECSEEHKLWAFKDGEYQYIKSKDLSVGDYVAIRYGMGVFGNNDIVNFYPEKGKNINNFSCYKITEDIAYFIGLFIAEGYARKIKNKNSDGHKGGQIVITCGDDVSDIINKLGLSYLKYDKFHYVINSKQLLDFILHLGFDINKKAPQKIIPESILGWSKNNITALLRGMFDGDGCITNKGIVSYTSTSRELIRQVQLLLANLGILGSIYENISRPTDKVKVYSKHYTIEITGKYCLRYFEDIGFGFKRKAGRINRIKITSRMGHNTDIVPGSAKVIKENINRNINKISLFSGRKKKFTSFSRDILLHYRDKIYSAGNENIKKFLDDNVSNNIIWLKIKEITKSENEVFDVSLPDIDGDDWCHSVLYNNFLGHQTPAGMNHYYKLWMEAKENKNEYYPFEIHWSDVPGRDEKWKKTQIANIGKKAFDQEFNTDFLGSSDTLISASKLSNLVLKTPITTKNSLDVYEDPQKDHIYVTIVDTAKGVEKDYSATVVVDVSTLPYKVVAKYRNNEIRPEMYSYVIKDVAMTYNESYLLCEVNEIGYQVARDLLEDGYPNMLMCSTKSRSGQVIGQNLSGKHEIGVKMQKNIKKLGSLNLKTLIEEDKLIINDLDIFAELTTFIQKGTTFEAESGKNDDLVDCLVLFSWLTTNQYFKDITDINLRRKLLEEREAREDEDLLPFGFSTNNEDTEIVDRGLIWTKVEDDEMNAILNLFNYY
jgi:intein/homing endonuclease